MPTNLTDQNIDETFAGLLHAQGTQLPVGTQVDLYDGVGNKSALKVGRANSGITVSGDSAVSGDLSASGRTITGHMEATGGSTAPNIAKAFITFNGLDGAKINGYGIDSVTREAAGRYIINIDAVTTSILDSLTADDYHIQVSTTIEDADFTSLKMFSSVANSNSTNEEVYVRCMRLETGAPPTINYFDPRHVHVAIYKS